MYHQNFDVLKIQDNKIFKVLCFSYLKICDFHLWVRNFLGGVMRDDAYMRAQYSKEFLRWALLVPGYVPEYHLGLRVKANKKLVACVTATPVKTKVYPANTRTRRFRRNSASYKRTENSF